MAEKKQTMRFNDTELSLIKNTFSENEDLLKAIRKVFLQMPLDVIDRSILTGTFTGKKDLIALINKTLNPSLDPNAPLHQLIDLWMSVDIKDKAISELLPVFTARKLLIDLLTQQIEYLQDITKDFSPKIIVSEMTNLTGKTAEDFYSNLMARNTLITHVDTQLTQLSILAGLKEETVEQTKNKLKKDSAK